MKLGELIKSKRAAAGLTLEELADLCGSGKSHIHGIESGKTLDIGIVMAAKLALALGISVNSMAMLVIAELAGIKEPTK